MSALEIFDCEQNSDEWLRVRMGMPTASEFSTVLTAGKGGGESKTRRTYLYKLAGERVTGEPMESYTNKYMERGKLMEGEARDYYVMLNQAKAADLCRLHQKFERRDTARTHSSVASGR